MDARKLAGPSTRRVLADGAGVRRQIGTFFAVNSRMVLTCRHVIAGARSNERLTLEGGPVSGDVGGLEWHCNKDNLMDVALGVLPDGTPKFKRWLTPVPRPSAEWRSPVHCLGYREIGSSLQNWQDHVSAPDLRFRLVVLQNDVHHGCSGGPVLDDGGQTVGIVVSRDKDGVEKHVLPVECFYRWLEGRGYRPCGSGEPSWIETVPIGPVVEPHDIPQAVITAFANAYPSPVAARNHIARANRLAKTHNPEGLKDREFMLRQADQPGFDVPKEFWAQVFYMMGIKSRRSVAALLAAEDAPVPEVHGQKTVFEAFRKLLSDPD